MALGRLFLALMMGVLFTSGAAATEIEVASGKVHEECFDMAAGQGGQYSFTASAPLDFNMHYHVGKRVFYLAGPEELAEAEDDFIVRRDQLYCLMWTNRGADGALLEYSYTLGGADVKDAKKAEDAEGAKNPAQADEAQTPGVSE